MRPSQVSTIVGQSNECDIHINGINCRALLDTGSNVSTISMGKYEELFNDVPIQPIDEFTLDIEGAAWADPALIQGGVTTHKWVLLIYIYYFKSMFFYKFF